MKKIISNNLKSIIAVFLLLLLGCTMVCGMAGCSPQEMEDNISTTSAKQMRYNRAKEVWVWVNVIRSPVSAAKDEYHTHTLYMYPDESYEIYYSWNNEPEEISESGTYEYYSKESIIYGIEEGFTLTDRTFTRRPYKYTNNEHTKVENGSKHYTRQK